MDEIVMTPELTPQGDSLPPTDIPVVPETDAAKAVEGSEDEHGKRRHSDQPHALLVRRGEHGIQPVRPSESQRFRGNCDCSSLVIHSLKEAG